MAEDFDYFEDFEDWDLIPPSLDDRSLEFPGFVLPTVKASQIAPPPRIQIPPRSPAVLQVPTALQPQGVPSGSTSAVAHSLTGCCVTVADVSAFPKQSFGIHRSAPYQLTDLHPGVNDRPIRQGYQPQSLQPHCSPPKALSVDSNSQFFADDLPPPPILFAEQSEQQGGHSKPSQRHGGSTSQQSKLVRLRKPSDSTLIVSNFDALLQEFGHESDVFRALSQSQFPEAHRNRLLDAYAASTGFRYMQAVQQFSRTVSKLGFDLVDLSVPQLVDCLTSMSYARSSSPDSMSGNFTLKALRWFKKIAGVPSLDIVYSPLADSS